MEFSPIQTEQTSAVTDLLLAFLAAYLILRLRSHASGRGIRGKVWTLAFLCIGAASLMGAIVHAFELGPAGERIGRMPVNLLIGLTVSCFAAGAVHDFLGEPAARRSVPLLLALGMVIPATVIVYPKAFTLMTVYGAIVLFSSLAAYLVLTARRSLVGTGLVALGILVSIVGTLIQATQAVHFTFVWEFDHNGTLHLIQLVGFLLLGEGLLRGFGKGKRVRDGG